jgi:P pilus assembly chaperone PapD
MKLTSINTFGATALALISTFAHATGVVPETSVVVVEQNDGEGSINVTNTEGYPVLLLSTLHNIQEDKSSLLTITPPAARIEAGKASACAFC